MLARGRTPLSAQAAALKNAVQVARTATASQTPCGRPPDGWRQRPASMKRERDGSREPQEGRGHGQSPGHVALAHPDQSGAPDGPDGPGLALVDRGLPRWDSAVPISSVGNVTQRGGPGEHRRAAPAMTPALGLLGVHLHI